MPGGVKTDVRTYQLYINGEWVDSKSNKTFPVYDPASEEVIAQAPDANADDVNRAVAAAKVAFERRTMGDHHRPGTRPRALPPRREDSSEHSHAGRAGIKKYRQADR